MASQSTGEDGASKALEAYEIAKYYGKTRNAPAAGAFKSVSPDKDWG